MVMKIGTKVVILLLRACTEAFSFSLLGRQMRLSNPPSSAFLRISAASRNMYEEE